MSTLKKVCLCFVCRVVPQLREQLWIPVWQESLEHLAKRFRRPGMEGQIKVFLQCGSWFRLQFWELS
jgi:hypothetical protein